jgi:hypothetical protein
MERKFETELEALLQRELKRLPNRKAPATLAPRIMAAIQAKSQVPAWRRPIWTLPRRTQWMVALLYLTVIVSLYSAANSAISFSQWASIWTDWANTGNALSEGGEVLFGSLGLVLRAFESIWLMLLALGVVLYLFCLATGSVFYQLAVKRN